MKADFIDVLTSPKSDPEFAKKYGLTVLCSAGAVLILPAIFLAGYLAQTMKHAMAGKKGLPEWKNLSSLAVQGGVCTLAGLYLLPAAMLLAVAYLPLMMGNDSFFSMGALLSRFISFCALILALAGLGFTLAATHSYLLSRRLGDLFNFSLLVGKLKAHMTEIGTLLTISGVTFAGLFIASTLLGRPGGLLALLGGALMNLLLANGAGHIFGGEPLAEAAALPGASEPALLSEPAGVEAVAAAETPVGEVSFATSGETTPPTEEDTWKPK